MTLIEELRELVTKYRGEVIGWDRASAAVKAVKMEQTAALGKAYSEVYRVAVTDLERILSRHATEGQDDN